MCIPQLAVVNDNRTPAGMVRGGVRQIHLEASVTRWLPDDGDDSTLTVQAFAERDGVPRIPSPLVRVTQGDSVQVTIVNVVPDSNLVLHGSPLGGDSIVIPRGESRTVTFTAAVPGRSRTGRRPAARSSGSGLAPMRNSPGAVVIDPAGTVPDTSERIFVITMMDVLPTRRSCS